MGRGPLSADFVEREATEKFGASHSAIATLREIASLHEALGVLRGEDAPPLYTACAHCGDCWRGEPEDAKPRADIAGISLPWIGPRYDETRVAVAGINLNEYGGPFAQWWIYHELRAEMATRKKYKGSMFAYGVGTYVSALLRSPGSNFDPPTSLEAAENWDSIAFTELVKCSPWRPRSKPNEEMWANCLGTYFLEELRILKPTALIVMGVADAAAHVQLLPGISHWQRQRGFQTGQLRVDQHAIDVYCCFHTAYGSWRESVPHLLAAQLPTPS